MKDDSFKPLQGRRHKVGGRRSKVQTENRARTLTALAKHPSLSYRSIRISEFEYGVGQFFDEELVGIVN